LKVGDGDRLQLRRCEVTGRRKGEFGGDPDLDNDGWGSDGGGGDGGDDNDGDDDLSDARHGGDDDANDGDSSNGGWGRGFGRCRRRESAEDQNDAEGTGDDDNQGEGDSNSNSVVQQWAQLHRSLGLPKKMTDEDAIDLVERLQSLPKQLKRKQQLPTPSSSGISKRARPVPADAGARDKSEVAIRPRRCSSVGSDWEIVSAHRVGHELGSPINLSGATETTKANATPPDSARRENVKIWLQDFLSLSGEDDDKAFIKRSDSPVPRAGGDDTGAARRESSMESDLEITFEGPVNRPFNGRGALIDLTDTPVDLTDELE
jgi:hypothetical protein